VGMLLLGCDLGCEKKKKKKNRFIVCLRFRSLSYSSALYTIYLTMDYIVLCCDIVVMVVDMSTITSLYRRESGALTPYLTNVGQAHIYTNTPNLTNVGLASHIH
jgi:hypothetical protein